MTWTQEPRRGPARLRHAGRAGRPRGPEPLVRRRRGAVHETDANDASPYSGIYLTTDKGRHWPQVYSEPTAHHQRVPSEIVWDPNTSGSGLTLYTTITRWDGSAVVRALDQPRRSLVRALDHPGRGFRRQRQGPSQLDLAPPEPVRRAVPLHAGRALQVDGRRRDLDPHERRRQPSGRRGAADRHQPGERQRDLLRRQHRRPLGHSGESARSVSGARPTAVEPGRRSPFPPAFAPRRSTSASPTAEAGRRSSRATST